MSAGALVASALALTSWAAVTVSVDNNTPPSPAPAPEIPRSGMDVRQPFLFVVLPILSLSSDEGVGGGAVFALQHHTPGAEPFRDDLSLRVFVTHRLVQRHELRWEGVDVFDLPLRAWVRVGLFSTLVQPFCGFGMGVTCAEGDAIAAALAGGLVEGTTPFQEFVRRYHFMRYIRPHADTVLRWRLRDKPHRFELLGGWRLSWYIPGSFTERGPWPGSLYAQVFPRGEPGVSSVPQLGFTLDDRDFEPAPTRGYFLEATLRAAHPWWGSSWTWAGLNVSLHGYAALLFDPSLVWAARLLVDLAAGDMPTEDLAQVGGIRDHGAFGGQWIGRGLRDRRVMGKLKVIHQSELRLALFELTVLGVRLDVGATVFGDVGWIGYDLDDLTGASGAGLWQPGHPLGLVYGGGLGLRVLVNRAVVSRVEVAASPLEQRSPSFFTPVGNSL